MNNWYDDVERQKRESERQAQQQKTEAEKQRQQHEKKQQEQQRQENIRTYQELVRIAGILQIESKLQDIAYRRSGRYYNVSTEISPSQQDGLSRGSNSITITLTDTVPSVTTVMRGGRGTPPKRGVSYGGTPIHIHSASPDYIPAKEYLKQGEETVTISISLSGSSSGTQITGVGNVDPQNPNKAEQALNTHLYNVAQSFAHTKRRIEGDNERLNRSGRNYWYGE